MKKIFVLGLTIALLFALQQTTITVTPEVRELTASIDASTCCDSDISTCNMAVKDVAIKTSKIKLHQLKKNYIFENKIRYKNQTATNFQGDCFSAKSLFVVYSGEKTYLLTNGYKCSSC